MAIFKKQAVIAEYPAYNVVKREKTHDGYVNLVAGDALVPASHLGNYRVNSVASYAIARGDCPIAAYERAVKNGQDTHYIMALGSGLDNRGAPENKPEYLEIDFDAVYRFEGRLFKIAPVDDIHFAFIPAE